MAEGMNYGPTGPYYCVLAHGDPNKPDAGQMNSPQRWVVINWRNRTGRQMTGPYTALSVADAICDDLNAKRTGFTDRARQ